MLGVVRAQRQALLGIYRTGRSTLLPSMKGVTQSPLHPGSLLSPTVAFPATGPGGSKMCIDHMLWCPAFYLGTQLWLHGTELGNPRGG